MNFLTNELPQEMYKKLLKDINQTEEETQPQQSTPVLKAKAYEKKDYFWRKVR
jgi:hypothetical protein